MTRRSTQAHASAERLLSTWAPPTADQEHLRKGYVELLLANPDGLHRSCHPDHITASTLVLSPDGAQTLLTLHAKAGRWFQLGGHVEPTDRSLPEAALREATEESGLDTLDLDPVPVHLDAHEVPFCGARPGTRHLDVRFLAIAPDTEATDEPPPTSNESADLQWWPVTDLPSDEPSLHELVRLARQRLLGEEKPN